MWALARASAVCIVYGRGPDPALARALSGEPVLRFWSEDELWTSGRDGEPLTAGDINTERDVLERAYLAGIVLGYWHLTRMARAPGAPLAMRHCDDPAELSPEQRRRAQDVRGDWRNRTHPADRL